MGEIRHGRNRMKRGMVLSFGIYLCIFLFMLVLNRLSLYITDDFRYLYSFHDNKRIERVSQILMSMRAHRYRMNGRIVPHTLVQIMGMLPMWTFDVVNSAMFVVQIMLIQKIARGREGGAGTLLMTFCGVWLFCPAFGQVNLWQDGSCNYLWSVVFALLFLLPYTRELRREQEWKSWYIKAGFLVLSFGMGAYSETASAAAIGMATLMVLFMGLYQKRKPKGIWLWGIGVAFLGYCSIYTAPAQWREKAAEMTAPSILSNFVGLMEYYWHSFGILMLVFLAALLWNFWKKTDVERVALGCVFFAGFLAAGFILTFASYLSPRSAIGAFAFLLTADVVLLAPAWEDQHARWAAAGLLVVLTVAAVPALVSGTRDVAETYQSMKANEAYIYERKARGERDIEVPLVTAKTKYSEASGLVYLNTEDPGKWPNHFMAVYYGVDTLSGVPE